MGRSKGTPTRAFLHAVHPHLGGQSGDGQQPSPLETYRPPDPSMNPSGRRGAGLFLRSDPPGGGGSRPDPPRILKRSLRRGAPEGVGVHPLRDGGGPHGVSDRGEARRRVATGAGGSLPPPRRGGGGEALCRRIVYHPMGFQIT